MSDADREKAQSERQGAEPLAGLSGVADEIKQLLSTLAGEIEASKHAQRQALGQIEARLTRIESDVRTDAGKTLAPQDQTVAAPGRGSAEPWDLDAAEALTKSYEDEDPEFVEEPPYRAPRTTRVHAKQDRRPPPVTKAAPGATDLERAWLGHRITDFTHRVKRSLAEMRPQSSLIALEERIDQFQKRIVLALDDVARRSDVDGLRRIEAHVGDLGGKLGLVQSQLNRFDGIEGHLRTVMDRLSDERLAEIAGQPGRATADLETVARFAAEETHARLGDAGGNADASGARYEELRSAIETSINERRAGERQAITMLDTMQQALIQVLDRIEAIEHATARATSAASGGSGAAHGHYDPVAELAQDRAPKAAAHTPPALSVDSHDLRDHEVDNGSWSELHADLLSGGIGTQPQRTAAGELLHTADPAAQAGALHDDELQVSAVDKLRRDFIADAQRARLKAAASRGEQGTLKVAARRPQIASRLSAWVSGQGAGGSGKILGVSPKLIVSALVIAVAINGALLIRLLHRPDAQVAQAATAASPALGAAERQSARPQRAQDRVASPEAVVQGLNFETGEDGAQDGVDPEATSVPRGALIQEMPAPASVEASAPSTNQDAVTDLSGGLGAVAAKANLASLFNEPDAGGGAAQGGMRPADSAGGKASALNLPPATVGPLSLRLAAANGDVSAEFEVAVRIAEGRGTAQNLEEAVRWYQRSAARGFAQAQYRLATHLERGFGTDKDISRARIWYQRAAEKGNIKAMHNLAVLSANSEQASPDYATATKWFAAAAERGLADSQYNLAVLYETGLGVPQDRVLAYKWYSLAAKGGDKDAIQRRDTMKGELTPADVTAAEGMTRTFSPKAIDALVNDPHAAGQDWKKRASSEANG
jgi:localization factor PodJL